jgi:hypothetical protein
MDNGQMARWVARVEHNARIEAHKQDEQFRRDIQPDDPDMRVTHTAVSSHVQPAGGVWSFIKNSVAALRARLGIKRESQPAHSQAGYKQRSV